MEILDAVQCDRPGKLVSLPVAALSKDLQLVLSVLSAESASSDAADRRQFCRCPYIVQGCIETTDPMAHTLRIAIYTRDANQWGIGLVTQAVLPVGQTVLVQIAGGDGVDLRARGSILRCREVLPGWYEAAVLFEAQQPSLAPAIIASQP